MSRTIDYYFSLVSPWAYIGHAPFMAIAARHGLAVNHKPVFLGRVFAETGGLPLAAAPPGAAALPARRAPALARQARAVVQAAAEALALRRQRSPTAS